MEEWAPSNGGFIGSGDEVKCVPLFKERKEQAANGGRNDHIISQVSWTKQQNNSNPAETPSTTMHIPAIQPSLDLNRTSNGVGGWGGFICGCFFFLKWEDLSLGDSII